MNNRFHLKEILNLRFLNNRDISTPYSPIFGIFPYQQKFNNFLKVIYGSSSVFPLF